MYVVVVLCRAKLQKFKSCEFMWSVVAGGTMNDWGLSDVECHCRWLRVRDRKNYVNNTHTVDRCSQELCVLFHHVFLLSRKKLVGNSNFHSADFSLKITVLEICSAEISERRHITHEFALVATFAIWNSKEGWRTWESGKALECNHLCSAPCCDMFAGKG